VGVRETSSVRKTLSGSPIEIDRKNVGGDPGCKEDRRCNINESWRYECKNKLVECLST
jgi:hypothetical protein